MSDCKYVNDNKICDITNNSKYNCSLKYQLNNKTICIEKAKPDNIKDSIKLIKKKNTDDCSNYIIGSNEFEICKKDQCEKSEKKIMNNSCLNKDELDKKVVCKDTKDMLTIFHIVNNIKETENIIKDSKNIKYKLVDSKNLSSISNFILNSECYNGNILIYSSYDVENIVKNLTKTLINILKILNSPINNLDIIFKANPNKLIPLFYDDNSILLIRKIVNIFPTFEKIKKNLFNTNPELYNKYKDLYNNANVSGVYDFEKKNIKDNNINYYINFRYEFYDYNEDDKEWWFKYINKVPICLRGRLNQMKGTCWFNASLNSIILPSKIKEIIKESWIDRENDIIKKYLIDKNKNISDEELNKLMTDKIKVKKILNEKKKEMINFIQLMIDAIACPMPKKLDEYMLALIYFMIIKNKKVSGIGNISSHMAARVKQKNAKTNTKTIIDNSDIKAHNKILQKELSDKMNKGEITEDEANKQLRENATLKEYNKEGKKYEKNNEDYTLGDGGSANQAMPILLPIFFKDDFIIYRTPEFMTTNARNALEKKNVLEFIKHSEKIGSNTNAKLICLLFNPAYNKKIPREIELNNNHYELQSCTISVSIQATKQNSSHSGHLIAGIKCNDDYYIYDSNGILAKCNWSEIFNDASKKQKAIDGNLTLDGQTIITEAEKYEKEQPTAYNKRLRLIEGFSSLIYTKI